MIIGRFGDTTKSPFVEGLLALQNKRTNISFLLDTGAQRSVLMPADAVKLGIDRTVITKACQSTGVGGISNDFCCDAIITFRGNSTQLYSYKIEIIVASPTAFNLTIPSLLGRDVINRWRVNYDPALQSLECTVNTADNILGITSKITLPKGSLKRGYRETKLRPTP